MSTAPETLLKMHPLDALRTMITDQIKTPLKASYLKVEKPVSLGGLSTSVSVSLDKSRAPVSLWDRVDTVIFTYDRLDLSTFTTGLSLSVAAELPSTPAVLMDNLFYKYGIRNGKSDFADDTYTALGHATVIASPDSWRWVGEIDCSIIQLGLEISGRVLVNYLTFSWTSDFTSANIKNQIATHLNLMNASSLADVITANMFTVSNITENGPQDVGDNTSVLLTFNGSPYIGSLTVYYGRRSWPLSFKHPILMSGPAVTLTPELAAQLSTQMGCTITTADIQSMAVPSSAVGGTETFPIVFADTSLAFVGAILVKYTRTS
jgi:hypothetical protein